MIMNDRLHVGTRAVDLAVNEPLEVDAATFGVDRVAVEIEGKDVFAPDQTRRHVAREQEMIGRAVVTDAGVAESVDHALPVQNAVGGDQLVDERGVGRGKCHGAESLAWIQSAAKSVARSPPAGPTIVTPTGSPRGPTPVGRWTHGTWSSVHMRLSKGSPVAPFPRALRRSRSARARTSMRPNIRATSARHFARQRARGIVSVRRHGEAVGRDHRAQGFAQQMRVRKSLVGQRLSHLALHDGDLRVDQSRKRRRKLDLAHA